MKKEILIGIAKHYGKVVLEIELERKGNSEKLDWITLHPIPIENQIRLSISGHYRGSWGQISDSIREMEWIERTIGAGDLLLLLEYWEKYHLNDTKAGTKLQSDFIQFAKTNPNFKKAFQSDHYGFCKHILNQHSLYLDCESNPNHPYNYGSKWLFAQLPSDVIDFINSYTPNHSKSETRSELLDWFIENDYHFTISPTDSNPHMNSNQEMDHWKCSFWKGDGPPKRHNIFKCIFSTGIGHRIGGMRKSDKAINSELRKWRVETFAKFGIKWTPFDKDKKSIKDLGFDCSVPTMVFSWMSNSIPVPPMPDDVLNCVAREVMDADNYGDWMDWATELGYDLNNKKTRRECQRAYMTIQDQGDEFKMIFHNFPFALVE